MRLTQEKYIFEFFFFLIFWIFINNNRNKITFEKILVDPKLGYNNVDIKNILKYKKYYFNIFLKTLTNQT
jgi:hypothetical protein